MPRTFLYWHFCTQDSVSKTTVYDRLFLRDYGYNEKLHRCDREHAKSRDLAVNEAVRECVCLLICAEFENLDQHIYLNFV